MSMFPIGGEVMQTSLTFRRWRVYEVPQQGIVFETDRGGLLLLVSHLASLMVEGSPSDSEYYPDLNTSEIDPQSERFMLQYLPDSWIQQAGWMGQEQPLGIVIPRVPRALRVVKEQGRIRMEGNVSGLSWLITRILDAEFAIWPLQQYQPGKELDASSLPFEFRLVPPEDDAEEPAG